MGQAWVRLQHVGSAMVSLKPVFPGFRSLLSLPLQHLMHNSLMHIHTHTTTHTTHTHTHTTLYGLEITLPMLQNFQCFTLQYTYFSSPNSPPTCTDTQTHTPILHPSQCSTPPNAPPLPMLYHSQWSTPPNALRSLPLQYSTLPQTKKMRRKKRK